MLHVSAARVMQQVTFCDCERCQTAALISTYLQYNEPGIVRYTPFIEISLYA
jgi:hypothetical protein